MGIFSKLRNLTGSWADVTVITEPGTRGESTSVMVQVSVRDEPIKVNRVYLTVRCVEEVNVPGVKQTGAQGNQMQPVNVSAREVLYDQEFTLATGVELDAGVLEAIEQSFEIPGQMPPSFTGRNARVVWQLRAGLDMTGNDPDSGWQDFNVS